MDETESGESLVRVLVVEDNPDDRDLLLRQLRKSGMDSHVKFISDGEEALRFLNSRANLASELIAIFLDLKLPSLSGIDVLRSLRSHSTLHNLPVIVMTSSNDPRDIEECQRLKVTNYVSKPVSFTSFSKAVADVFHRPPPASRPTIIE